MCANRRLWNKCNWFCKNSWDAQPLKTVGMLYEEPDQLQIDISGAKPNRPRCVIFRLYLVLCFSWYSEAQSESNDMKGWLWVWLSIVEKPQRAPIWWSEAGGPIIWELTCGRRKVVLCEYCGYCKIGTIGVLHALVAARVWVLSKFSHCVGTTAAICNFHLQKISGAVSACCKCYVKFW